MDQVAAMKGRLPNDRRNMFVWDFGVTSGGHVYKPAKSKFGSVAWRVFSIPFAARVIGNWMHTHSQVASDMFIIEGNVENALPSELVHQCYSHGNCISEGI